MSRALTAASVALALLTISAAGPILLGAGPGSAVPRAFGGGGLTDDPTAPVVGLALAGYDARFALTSPLVAHPLREALVIVRPTVGYDAADVDAILKFANEGGKIIVADTGGAGAELLVQLNIGIRIHSSRVYSPGFNGTPQNIVTLNSGEVPGLPPEVALTRPAVVEGGRPVLEAPALSWLDKNDNGRPDLGEVLRRGMSLASMTEVGRGQILVIGHPDAVNPRVLPELAAALLAFLTDDGARTLVFDEAHRTRADPFGTNALLAGRSSPGIITGMLMFTLVLGAAVVLAPRITRARPRPSRYAGRDMPPALLRELLEELDSR